MHFIQPIEASYVIKTDYFYEKSANLQKFQKTCKWFKMIENDLFV